MGGSQRLIELWTGLNKLETVSHNHTGTGASPVEETEGLETRDKHEVTRPNIFIGRVCRRLTLITVENPKSLNSDLGLGRGRGRGQVGQLC
jgi:hypothetical protein